MQWNAKQKLIFADLKQGKKPKEITVERKCSFQYVSKVKNAMLKGEEPPAGLETITDDKQTEAKSNDQPKDNPKEESKEALVEKPKPTNNPKGRVPRAMHVGECKPNSQLVTKVPRALPVGIYTS